MRSDGLTDSVISSVAWRFGSVIAIAGTQFFVSIVLARLIPPSQFGLMAFATVFTGLGMLFTELGVGASVVQRKDLAPGHVRVAWTISLFLGLALALILNLIAGFIPSIAGAPSPRPILRALSVGFFFSGMTVVSSALLRRRLAFRQLFMIDTASYLFGYVAVTLPLAFAGFDVWALVAGYLSSGLLTAVLTYARVRHPLRLGFKRREARELVGFGTGATISGLLNFLALNMDYFIVGRTLGAAPLGLYQKGYYLMALPLRYVARILSNVLFPAYSRMQQDRRALARSYLISMNVVFLVTLPAMMLTLVNATDIVSGLYGERWIGTAPVLRVLAVFGVLRAMYHMGGTIAQATGRVYAEARREALYAALVVAGALVGSRYGIVGVAWGVGLAILGMNVAMAQLVVSITSISWRRLGQAHLAGLVLGVIVLVIALVARRLLLPLELPDLMLSVADGVVASVPALICYRYLPANLRYPGSAEVLIRVCGRLPKPAERAGMWVLRAKSPTVVGD